ncbi:PH domain-containing protein [Glutamicibacter protophormiae]|uniref:SHOCT domain-containing protein n=1 Tax=Kocuria rhizophila TaxID=72000 RepID=UPI00073D933D|nr:SHOCT domain-containing protein [Kocuria rhizophila]MCT1544876.1 PH domain-containing protein [Kocuria rhizophila]MCT2249686.1 PH domain-containing protein [Kocuria rhizophila]WNB88620.1 PH domain-containing protein [Glutamicibacter protophormiae]
MGIKVMNQWVLRLPMEQADTALRVGLEQMGASPYGSLGRIEGKTKAALMRNRYGAKITVDLTEHPEGTLVEVLIDALGDKQQEMLDELAATLPAGVLDDHGITAEIEKLGKMSRLFGKRELSHLRRILNPEERVVALGQGTYEKLQSLIVLTDQRLVLLEKGIVRETVKEFQLSAISSLSLQKGWGGESLDFTASGAKGAITSMMPGQGERFAAAYRQLRNAPAVKMEQPAAASAEPDVLGQLEQLGKLRDAGVLTDAEFESKKAELLHRL